MLNGKDQVLVCAGLPWRTTVDIAQETAFVNKLEYTEAHDPVVYLHLAQLKAEQMVEEHCFGDAKRPTLWRLTRAGQAQQELLIAANPRIAVAREDFLFAGCPI